jgi:hypothetical protein
MHYVIKNIETGKYVARPGLEHSYTKKPHEIRVFKTRVAAEAELCVENERIEEAPRPELFVERF